MATWVYVKKAEHFPHVLQVYSKVQNFRDACEREAAGSAVWARRDPGSQPGTAILQVDVAAIPGVPPLRPTGRRLVSATLG